MAAAYSARQLGIPATIIVPSVTPKQTVERLKDEGATVLIHGKVRSSAVMINYCLLQQYGQFFLHSCKCKA